MKMERRAGISLGQKINLKKVGLDLLTWVFMLRCIKKMQTVNAEENIGKKIYKKLGGSQELQRKKYNSN